MDLAELDRMLNDPVSYLARKQRPPSVLPPAEYDSALKNITGAPLSALAWLGDTLDKPGRAVRGLLGGRPEELANLIPFSDTLGITNSEGLLGGTPLQVSDRENALSGRDLLREYGLVGNEDNWGNFAAGLGTEIALDPLNLLSLGTGTAVTQAGKIAAKAGLLPARAVGIAAKEGAQAIPGALTSTLRSLAPHIDEAARIAMEGGQSATDVLGMLGRTNKSTGALLNAAKGGAEELLQRADEPLSALAKYGLGDYAAYAGLGEAGVPVGRYLDAASDAWKASLPGRMTAKLFERTAGNRATAAGQEMAREKFGQLDAANPEARMLAAGERQALDASGITDPLWSEIGLYVGEKNWPNNLATLPEREAEAAAQGKTLRELSFEKTLAQKGIDPATVNYRPMAAAMDAQEAASRAERQKLFEKGLLTDPGVGSEYASYMHRQLDLDQEGRMGQGRAFPTFGASDIHRNETFDVPAGVGKLQELANDQPLRQLIQNNTVLDDLKAGATEAQIADLAARAGMDPNTAADLTKWQAQHLRGQLDAGVPPDQLELIGKVPERASKIRKRAIDAVMGRVFGDESVEQFRTLQRVLREGPSLAEYFAQLPEGTPIPPELYNAFYNGGQHVLKEEVDDLFAKEGWAGIADALDNQVSSEAQNAARQALGISPVELLSEADQEAYQALQSKFKQSLNLARFYATNPGQWSTSVLENNLAAHLDDIHKNAALDALHRGLARHVDSAAGSPEEAQRLFDALKSEPVTPPPTPGNPMPAPDDALARTVNAAYRHTRQLPEGQTRLIDALEQIGLSKELHARARMVRSLAQNLESVGKLAPGVAEGLSKGDANALIALNNLTIPTDLARDLTGFVGGNGLSKEMGPLVQIWDNLTNLLKNHLTVPFPSFAARNFLSLLWQDGVSGGFANPMAMAKNWRKSWDLLRTGTIDGASQLPLFAGRHLTDEQAAKELSALIYAHGIAPNFAAADLAGSLPDATLRESLPAKQFAGMAPLSGYMPNGLASFNPLAVRGGPTAETGLLSKILPASNDSSKFFLAKGGEQLNAFAEATGRVATFLRKLEEGYAPEQAALLTKGAHVDYSQLAPFEREVLKRIAPFYSYTRHAAPWNLREIASKPGGLVAQSIRATTQDEQGYVPEQAVGGIPIGNEVNGVQRYLNLDLPVNVLDDLAGGGNGLLGTLQQTGYRQLSMLHPALKAPLELITGQSFFQRGRPLTDLYSRTGTGTLGDTALMNSPLSRYITTASMLGDPRKGIGTKALNLLSGVRLSDVNIEQSRERAAAKAAMDLLREGGAKTFERMYFPEDYQPTPEEEQLMLMLQTQAARRRAGNKL
jgi:hypothetical protein